MMFKAGDKIRLKSLDSDVCYGVHSYLRLFYTYEVMSVDSTSMTISGNKLHGWVMHTSNVYLADPQLLFDFMEEA